MRYKESSEGIDAVAAARLAGPFRGVHKANRYGVRGRWPLRPVFATNSLKKPLRLRGLCGLVNRVSPLGCYNPV